MLISHGIILLSLHLVLRKDSLTEMDGCTDLSITSVQLSLLSDMGFGGVLLYLDPCDVPPGQNMWNQAFRVTLNPGGNPAVGESIHTHTHACRVPGIGWVTIFEQCMLYFADRCYCVNDCLSTCEFETFIKLIWQSCTQF